MWYWGNGHLEVADKKLTLLCIVFRGFLKADKFLGTATVKLTPLETKCTFHDSFDVSFLFLVFERGEKTGEKEKESKRKIIIVH